MEIKHIWNSPGLWPTGVLDPSSFFFLPTCPFQLSFFSTFPLAFFPSGPFASCQLASFYFLVARVAALGTPAAQSSSPLASGAPFGDPLVGFSDFFTFRSDFKNSDFFGTAQKDQKVDNEVPKVSPKSTFGSIRMDFQSHFGIVFSTFSENDESVL